MSEFHELRFVVFVPKGGGDIREYHISASPDERGGKFKERVSKACNVPADDLDLFWNNAGQRDGNKSWLDEEKTLAEQGMEDGAEVMVGIHGLQECGAVPSDDEETAEGERSAVDDSIRRMGAASYYRWAAGKKENLAPEHRIATGGAPPVITTIEDPAPLEECGRRVVSLKNYSWGDEKEVIKIPDITEMSESEKEQLLNTLLERALDRNIDFEPNKSNIPPGSNVVIHNLSSILMALSFHWAPRTTRDQLQCGSRATPQAKFRWCVALLCCLLT